MRMIHAIATGSGSGSGISRAPHPEMTPISDRPASTPMTLSSHASSPSTSLVSSVLSRKGIGKTNGGKTGAGDTLINKGIGKPAASKKKAWLSLFSSSAQAYHKRGPLRQCSHPPGSDHHWRHEGKNIHGVIDEYQDMPGLVVDKGIIYSDARASSTLDDKNKHVDTNPHGKMQERHLPLL